MYLFLPLTGAIIGLGTYFVIRGGFVSPTTTAKGFPLRVITIF